MEQTTIPYEATFTAYQATLYIMSVSITSEHFVLYIYI